MTTVWVATAFNASLNTFLLSALLADRFCDNDDDDSDCYDDDADHNQDDYVVFYLPLLRPLTFAFAAASAIVTHLRSSAEAVCHFILIFVFSF